MSTPTKYNIYIYMFPDCQRMEDHEAPDLISAAQRNKDGRSIDNKQDRQRFGIVASSHLDKLLSWIWLSCCLLRVVLRPGQV